MIEGIDCIVVNYQTPLDLMEFLASFEQFRPEQAHQLHVCNVAPLTADNETLHNAWVSTEYICPHSWERNVGYARAVNHAAQCHAGPGLQFDIIAIFNADVLVTESALDICADQLRDSDWGALGPRQVDLRGRITSAGIFGTFEAPAHRGWQKPDRDFNDVLPAVTVSGSAYFIKRSVWEELTWCPQYRQAAPDAEGAFLPTPHYYEETYCSYHAQAHGYPVMYYGPVRMIHKWHKASTVGGWAERQFPISQDIFRRACDIHGIPHD